jgi:acetolactate synthase-1/2/3 large subunit
MTTARPPAGDHTVPVKTIPSGTTADAYLALLADRGVDYLFANAGTDFAPLIEALAKAEANGTAVPKPVTVPHENVAIHMALGYYLKTGKPQLVMVHVNVGTANAVAGIMNAWRGNIPVLMSAGRTPYSEEGGLTGQRTGEIHWPQEMRDQRAIVREITKWDYELPNAQVLETTVDRALNIAMAEPKGPIYLTLPREVLAAPVSNFIYTSPSRHATPSAPYPDPRAIDEAAEMIARAERPVIVTANAGRDEDDVAKLAALAECFAIPVTQRKPRYMCLPTDHPMHLGYEPDPVLANADLVIVMECDVPWIPGKKSPPRDAKVIHLGVDPLFSAYPIRGFTCDLAISGVLGATLPALTEALLSRQGVARDRIEARRKRLAEERAAQREKWAGILAKAKTATPMHPAWITHCLNEVKGEDAIVVKESPLTWEHLSFSKPGTFFSIAAAGALGWGLGTSLGLKAAVGDKLVICTCGDGAYMFGNPVPAHYVSAAEKLPILTVVFNNQMWGAVKRNTLEVYPEGFAAKSNREPLTYFDPALKFEKAVEVAGGHGEQVSDPAEMPKAIERALKVIRDEKRQALLNVVCRGPG